LSFLNSHLKTVRKVYVAGVKPYPSLLPYLDTGKGRFRLHISLISSDRTVSGEAPYPFEVVAEAGPFARIIAGSLLSDAGSLIKPVFLLYQPDQYPDFSDNIRPLTNADIDRFWQEAYHRYRATDGISSPADSMLLLAGQSDAHDRLLPCCSLFYCILRQIYFHPLCPQCGSTLQVCRQEGVLKAAGLKSYGASLRRYLYCPDCAAKADRTNFYVFERQPDDPPDLKDRWGLVHDLGNLLVSPDPAQPFPCSSCPEQTACYGPQDLSRERIVPFAFYPFYLMIFDAATLHAVDFVAMLSGATLDQLAAHVTEPGRRYVLDAAKRKLSGSSRFLFNNSDSRHFLETLFLKLSFLRELSAWALQTGSLPEYPNLPLSLNRVWLRLPDQAGLLPSLWNFKPVRFDVGLPEYGHSLPLRHTTPSGLYWLATTWFYTLLVNRRQDIRQVSEILDRTCEKLLSSAAPVSLSLFQEIDASPFRPENAFWDPAGGTLEPDFESLWHQSLYLGASLLRAGLDREVPWSLESFNQQFDELRNSVQRSLFSGRESAEQFDAADRNAAIAHILQDLSRRWRSEPAQRSVAEDLQATVLVSRKIAADNASAAALARLDDDLQKTVILQPKPPVPEAAEQSRTAEEEEEKTVILSARAAGLPTRPDNEPPEDDLIQETVLLSSRESIPGFTGPQVSQPVPREPDLPEAIIQSPGEQDLEKTVIQRPVDSGASNNRKEADDQDLEQTIVMKPTAGKDKKPAAETEDDLGETVIMKPKPGKNK
jgi:hypothetical protein